MRSISIPFAWRANAIALAFGLAIIGLGAGLGHSQTANPANPPAATRQAQQAAAPGFVCDAHPGGWCDLRDWSHFGQTAAHTN